ncbi:MAG: response regulator [Halioglobus sp.]|nr:response regulator [Halioglobus sp.]
MIIARSKTIRAKILVVDDEEMILELMSETIADTGYECFVAKNVDAAVEIVKTTPEIVLIITDLKMPGKTGADLIKIVEAELKQEMKFIVMSGHGSPRIEENGVDIASYPFIRKPLGIDSLIEKISSVLEAK